MKIYYFDLYARAEPTRMMLYKAGVQFEDNRMAGDAWKEFKESGVLEYGQMPMLELDDGTRLVQTAAIQDFVASTYGFFPESAMDRYKTAHLMSLFNEDFVARKWYKVFQAPDDQKAEMAEQFMKNDVPWFMNHLERKLEGHKFILGDKLTLIDFVIGGYLVNAVHNPNNKMADGFKQIWEGVGEKTKAYCANFQEEMKEYLESRPQNCTM